MPNNILNCVSAEDALLSKGIISYIRIIYSNNGTILMTLKGRLSYRGKLFKREESKMGVNNTSPPLTTLFDGTDEFVISNGQVTINPGESKDLKEYSRWFSVYPGPCFIIGRGLSSLSNKSVNSYNNVTQVKGAVTDGTVISAVLDTQHGDVAKLIERRERNGRVISQLKLGRPMLYSGSYIASEAIYSAARGSLHAKPKLCSKLIISKAVFADPNIDFKVNLQPGSLVVDNRLGMPMVWRIVNKKTSAELLEQTKKRLIKSEDVVFSIQRKQQQKLVLGLILLSIPVFIIIGLVLYRKSKKEF